MIRPGAWVAAHDTRFAVRAPLAEAVSLCLWDDGDADEHQVAMTREGDWWTASVPGDHSGALYGYRAHGEWKPDQGKWFDPAKLLVDPYAVELDRRFVQSPDLASFGVDTAAIVPRAIIPGPLPEVPLEPVRFTPGGLIYEINVRSFTKLHPDVPESMRGTIAALAHPAIVAHLRKLAVTAIELMPITAWIDERHLAELGLANAWGYNPVVPMAIDPGLCPGGLAELRKTVAALHAAGIGVILDLVFNHTGESDVEGGVLSFRGLDDGTYARQADGSLVNVTGCGNTLDFAQDHVRQMTLDTLRHFVRHCGVDGFRFDLAPVLARGPDFDPAAPIFSAIATDEWLADRAMIAEPWDIGEGGYQLGHFPEGWLEWNDRFRDGVRRFWRGDGGVGDLATRIAGSSDIFGQHCRSVNFLAAHDGFTLADTLAYAERHNEANGENNKDGTSQNYSWNNGAEGPSDNPQVVADRAAFARAMLGTLFASTGTIMLTAGDEFGRTQAGNNNAYCQDNATNWLDWENRDRALENYVIALSHQRAACVSAYARFPQDGRWLDEAGNAMEIAEWQDNSTDGFAWQPPPGSPRPPIRINRSQRAAG